MQYNNGEQAEIGDVIRWKCYDSDDFTTWTFTGLVKSNCVVYLGGGIDFGHGIGQEKSHQEVIDEAENNDAFERGIDKVGTAYDLWKYIQVFAQP